MNVFTDLERRAARLGRPVEVGVVGAGFLGGGLVHHLAKIRGMRPAVVANRTPERALAALARAGVDPSRIERTEDPERASRAVEAGRWVVTASPALPALVPRVDVVVEATGTLRVGAEVALEAIRNRKHIVAANPEVMCTVGALLEDRAERAGVVYTDIDGDQPGIILNLYNWAAGLGLEPVVAGNCKGVLKRYATPKTQEEFARKAGISPWIATAAADGTKLALEMAIVANATGMRPVRTGMVGLETKLETLLEDFSKAGLLSAGPIVEYTLGIPSGVFVVARSEDPHVRGEFRYLKMGDGPDYLFYRPYVLCQFETPLTIAEAVLYETPTIAPRGMPTADVATWAKRDLRSGERLGPIGGENHYGLVVGRETLRREGGLPVGLAEFAVLRRDVRKDAPVRLDDVELDEGELVVRLRREEDRWLSAKAGAA